MSKTISGFSKLSKQQKISWLAAHFFSDGPAAEQSFAIWQHPDSEVQQVVDGFTENAIANFVLPLSVAPNFLINGRTYAVPMVIEESSVVAAASSAAKFWADRGGIHAEVLGTTKLGQVHFRWWGASQRLRATFPALRDSLLAGSEDLTANMEKRGGGIRDIELLDFTHAEPYYYQLRVSFETCDSMGANFINSVLERFADTLEHFLTHQPGLTDTERDMEVVMSILSNYTPQCVVRAWAETPISSFESLARSQGMDAAALADRFAMAVRIATIDPYRATTHNKGIFNGIDAVVLATGNDFRAVEACGHTYAARDGQYRSLSRCRVEQGMFHFELEVPLALGTVGGLTALHPLAKRSLEMLGNPSATELMCIAASVGLAQNFAAVRSLITTGIQQGHMKMHLTNVLRHLGADEKQMAAAQEYFADRTVSFSAVREFLEEGR
ncbi:MAG TPA: hydroxymethylglutaryl-CoA reductase, degradative [Saprospiraceae bacterium]|nr:hydroxymethylglutaryl-CoA reductase, degradative [Saprospiraceae bacterium]HND87262.1 hydroxymethylglutaryl-CoA reductase, degradative [Saprospiraceae bacterium]HNG88758.1 hydroxymethylglutaryl-CoA reductase, degradative [Saprospiraceae bacterium]